MFKRDTATAARKRINQAGKRHFDDARFQPVDYPHRLNFYMTPPTEEVTLDEFEQWAIQRLKVLTEIESAISRNKTPDELKTTLNDLLKKHLPLDANSSRSDMLIAQRRTDHYSHFILRLAFARSEELRKRFSKAETILFRHRLSTDDGYEREAFVASLGLDWEPLGDEEKREVETELRAAAGAKKNLEGTYYKIDFERVPELVERRMVFLKRGKAYVPASLQTAVVVGEFTNRLEKALELTARALPRLDEDERLIPILNHLSHGFTAPEFTSDLNSTHLPGASITAASIDTLSQHFPACMHHLHTTLRRNKHLKHFGRLQYTLFLKGIGLSVDEALIFWRSSFSTTAEDKFNKEYRYNIRHAYGLEGNRRDYKPHSCQQILLEHAPGSGEAHGCPYRHFGPDNLRAMLQTQLGVTDNAVLQGVKSDNEDRKYHLACNRVFEWKHREELKKEKESGKGGTRETIIHPNEYFLRSWELTHQDEVQEAARKMEGMGMKDEAMV